MSDRVALPSFFPTLFAFGSRILNSSGHLLAKPQRRAAPFVERYNVLGFLDAFLWRTDMGHEGKLALREGATSSTGTRRGSASVPARWEPVNRALFWVAWAIAVGTLLTAVLVRSGVGLPGWLVRWVLPILATAAVGYLTNWLAIQMLFVPYREQDGHWLRWVTLGLWRQGVIPSRRTELAESVSRELVTSLLTPERVAEELTRISSRLFDEFAARQAARSYLGPLVREHLPGLVDRLTPEVMSLLREAARRGFSRESLIRFTEQALDPWLKDQESRRRLVQLVVRELQRHVPTLRARIEELVRGYAESGWLRRVGLALAEVLGVIDWDEFERLLHDKLGSHEVRQQLYAAVGDIGEKLRAWLASTDLDPVIRRLEQSVSDFLATNVEAFLREELPEICNRLADSPALWRWVQDEALPNLAGRVQDWLASGGANRIVTLLDIEKLTREGLNRLSVEELHERANRLAGPELAAIQVLGFLVGAIAGVLLAIAMPAAF